MILSDNKLRTRGRLLRVGFLDGEGYQFLADPTSDLEALKKAGPRCDLFTFIQKLSEPSPKYSYPLEWENIAALPISTFEHWMKSQIDFKVRNKVRKAEKNGVVVKEVSLDEPLLMGISAIYNECPVRQGRRFWHYGKDIATLRTMKATFLERSIFIGAFFNDTLIGFAKLVADESWGQAGLMHIVSMMQHRDKAPTNALIAQAVKSCAERKIPYLWYANFSYGKKKGDSLEEFKRHNGFQKIDIPRYYVPLTTTGRIALRIGAHHGINEWIPESVASRYRRLRSVWYRKRFAGLESA